MKFNETKEVCEQIMEMRDIAAQLKLLEIEMSESFFVDFILNSLLSEYGYFKIFYNKHKEKWSINECMQKKKKKMIKIKLNQEMIESSHLVTNEKKTTKKGKGKTHIN